MSNGSELPSLTSVLLDQLDKEFPPVAANLEDLVDEERRLRLAREIGKRDLIDTLLFRWRKQQREPSA